MALSTKRKNKANLHRSSNITDFFTTLAATEGNEIPEKHVKHQKLKRSQKADDRSRKQNSTHNENAAVNSESINKTSNKDQHVETIDAVTLPVHTLHKQKHHLPSASLFKFDVKSIPSDNMSCNQGPRLPYKGQSEVPTQLRQRNRIPERAKTLHGDDIGDVPHLATCRTLQPGGHVTQHTNDPQMLWCLPWPASPLLRHQRESTPMSFSSALHHRVHSDLLNQTTTQTDKHRVTRGLSLKPQRSGWRQDLPEDVLDQLLQEVKEANPLFPAQKLFTALSKKRSKHEEEWINQDSKKSAHIPGMADHRFRGKRKWRVEVPGQGVSPKRRRTYHRPEENKTLHLASPTGCPLVTADHTPVRLVCQSRLSRTRRRQQQQGKEASPSLACKASVVMTLQDIWKGVGETTAGQQYSEKECLGEEVLWTEKYQPAHSSEVVGNGAGVRRLQRWLKEWKLRADKEECRRRKDEARMRKRKESWDSGDFEGEMVIDDCETELCNAVLIIGPHGIGKTAAVYACAQELGFKVFEVNASSQRSGRLLLSQLKEATQSHQVDSSTGTSSKPSYFTSHTAPPCSTKPVASSLEGKADVSSKFPISTLRLPTAQRTKSSLKRVNTVKLTHFFQKRTKPEHSTENGGQCDETKNEKTTETDSPVKHQKVGDEDGNHSLTRAGRATIMSLILFEEVDVIFSEDVGFLSAIKTFMSTTKRPVILTTTDPLFGGTFADSLEELHFKKPSTEVVCSYLQLVCLAEQVRTDPRDICSLWAVKTGDIRQGLLQLQFWVRSGGGIVLTAPGPLPVKKSPEAQEESAERLKRPDLPVLDGVCPGTPQERLDIWAAHQLARMFTLTSVHSWTASEHSTCLEVLSESQKKATNLLYLTMESLLPLPTTCSPNLRDYKTLINTGSYEDKQVKKLNPTSCVDGNEVLGGMEAPKLRKRRCLSLKGQRSRPMKDTKGLSDKTGTQTTTKKAASSLVSRCLDSLAVFLDDLSFLDCSLQDRRASGRNVQHGLPTLPFVRLGAEIRDGMLDELGEEQEENEMCLHRSAEMRAAVEDRSFTTCCVKMEQVVASTHNNLREELGAEQWKQVVEQLTIPPPPHGDGLLWGQPNHSETSAVEARADVVKTVLSSGAVNRLGSSQAVITDYLPYLRTICKSESQEKQARTRHRQPHYLRRIRSGLSKSTLQLLSNDFP